MLNFTYIVNVTKNTSTTAKIIYTVIPIVVDVLLSRVCTTVVLLLNGVAVDVGTTVLRVVVSTVFTESRDKYKSTKVTPPIPKCVSTFLWIS